MEKIFATVREAKGKITLDLSEMTNLSEIQVKVLVVAKLSEQLQYQLVLKKSAGGHSVNVII